MVLNYTCEHSHNGGHTMSLCWEHGIELIVSYDTKKVMILKDGEVKNMFSAEGMPLNEFHQHIEACQQMDDQIGALQSNN